MKKLSKQQNLPVTFNYIDCKEYSIQPIRWLLKPISVWPVTDSSIVERILSVILLIVCIFLIMSTLVPCGLAIFLDETKDVDMKMRDFGPLSNWVLASLKYISLLARVDDIRGCLKHIEMDWRAVTKVEEQEVMLRNARIGRFIAIFSATFIHCGVFSYGIFRGMALSAESAVQGNNVSMRPLPFAFYDKILDTTTSPIYEIVFVIQCLSTFVVNSVVVGTCSLTAVFVMHACAQLKILISLLDNLINERNEKRNSSQQKFAVIIEHHLKVLSFVSHIEKITNVVCLVEIVGCTLHMCLLGYYCILDWNQDEKEGIVAYGIILVAVIFNIFIFCYIGEILSEQCGQVGEAAYMTNWYLLPGNTALGLVLIILKSSIVVKITAGKMIELSLSTFGNVIKSALAYLNILRTLMIIQIIRWILKAISAWPRSANASIVDKIWSDFAIFMCYFLIIAIMIPNGLSMLMDSQMSYETKLQNFGPLTFWFIAMVNYSCLLMHVDDIHDCVEHVKTDWRIIRSFEDRRVMLKTARLGRFIAGFCAVFMHCGVFSYNIVQGLSKSVLQVDNSSIMVRNLPYPFYNKILNAHFSPAYECVFFVQFLSSFVVNCVTVATCSVAAVFVMHACGQMKIMISWLENLIDNKNEERTSVKQRFAIIVNHHLRILRLSCEHRRDLVIIMLGYSKSKSIEPATSGWNYSIQLNRWFMKPIGAWPLTLCETTLEKISCVILTMISCFLICFLLIPCTLCTILVDTDLDTKIRMIGPLSFILMAAVKQYILINRSESISECFQHVRADWSHVALSHEKDREIMVNNAKFGRWLSSVSAIFMYSAGIFFTTVMPICARRTEIIDNETVRSLSFPIYRGLFDPRTTPSFEIAQFMQALAGYVIYTITIGVCSLAAILVMHACGQFRILMLKMEDLADGKERKSANSTHEGRLGDIVKHHIRILSFITRTEKLLNEICLVDVVGCTLNICFLGFNMMTEWENRETLGTMTFCSLLISFTFNIFILCYIGELLAEQCIQIGMKSYMIDWYRIPNKGALGLTLVMAMSNATIKLTAGKFMDLSLASFCSVSKDIVLEFCFRLFIYKNYFQLFKNGCNEKNFRS
ncbi:uncharacterized protein LOC105835747 [Monomorium pharaonis]|uniref:uncharacterized protein LOC105835747 n=1 Tax=Monomorium pharaonis TaxID=307658 RepID=UPI001747A0F6|nr:uncharacterized protein LOC105835747 [Monomorium pharaonis]